LNKWLSRHFAITRAHIDLIREISREEQSTRGEERRGEERKEQDLRKNRDGSLVVVTGKKG
jgi:hypothetical protein